MFNYHADFFGWPRIFVPVKSDVWNTSHWIMQIHCVCVPVSAFPLFAAIQTTQSDKNAEIETPKQSDQINSESSFTACRQLTEI